MPNPEGLDAYRTAFGGRAPHCQPDLCLNANYKQAGCTLCVDACPVGAITLSGNRPQLHENSCVHCGACLPACPTDAFTQASEPESTLVQTAIQMPGRSLVVVCPVHQQPAASRTPAERVIRHRRCLAALSTADLLALSRDGTRDIWLDDTPCAMCRVGGAHSQIITRASQANSLLAAFGYGRVIFPLTQQADQISADLRTLPIVDGMQPKVSRRGLFDVLRTAATDRVVAEPPTDSSSAPQQSAVSAHLPQNTPPSRIELLQHVERLHANTASDFLSGDGPFTTVAADPQLCSGCGLCVRVCPTGALTFDADDEHFSLTTQVPACIGCSVCVIACPEEAVTLTKHWNPAAWLDPEPVDLVDGELTPCEECGVATAAHSIEGAAVLCYVCRPSPGLVRALHSDHGAAFDLGWKERAKSR